MDKGTFNIDEYSNLNNFHVIELSPSKNKSQFLLTF